MNNSKKIKLMALKFDKKIGKDSINKIESILEKNIEELIKKSSRNADFFARKTIKPNDIE